VVHIRDDAVDPDVLGGIDTDVTDGDTSP